MLLETARPDLRELPLHKQEAIVCDDAQEQQPQNYRLNLNFTVDNILQQVPKYKPRQYKEQVAENSYVKNQG